jgi:hypothetical protein
MQIYKKLRRVYFFDHYLTYINIKSRKLQTSNFQLHRKMTKKILQVFLFFNDKLFVFLSDKTYICS